MAKREREFQSDDNERNGEKEGPSRVVRLLMELSSIWRYEQAGSCDHYLLNR
jgi:hypothetical protein